MSQHPVAFIDESYTKSPQHPGAYLLSAVLIDQDNLTTTQGRSAPNDHHAGVAFDGPMREDAYPFEAIFAPLPARSFIRSKVAAFIFNGRSGYRLVCPRPYGLDGQR